MKGWSRKEIEYLKQNYSDKTNTELQSFLKRSKKAILFQAWKSRLKKNEYIINRAKKRTEVEVTKSILERLYSFDKKPIRKIASELKLGKNTIDYYLKKYRIKKRSISDARKNYYSNGGNVWKLGKTKDNSEIVRRSIEKMKETYIKKRIERLALKEKELGDAIPNIINKLYWKEGLTQEQIAQKTGLSRLFVIQTMKKERIEKKPNFRVISSVSGENHPMRGKTWKQFYGKEEADRMKKEYSLRSQRLMIERLKSNKMPFSNTEIEKKIYKEMYRREIPFVFQYNLDNKFLCDFAIPKNKIIIECDGDYWHANPSLYDHNLLDKRQKINLKRDKFKDEYLKRKGWTIIRFFENEIHSSLKKCVDKIEEKINLSL